MFVCRAVFYWGWKLEWTSLIQDFCAFKPTTLWSWKGRVLARQLAADCLVSNYTDILVVVQVYTSGTIYKISYDRLTIILR